MALKHKPSSAFIPTNPIIPFLDSLCLVGGSLAKKWGKVRGVLEKFAESEGTTPGKLRIMDVFTTRAELRPRLVKFINSLPRYSRQSEQRVKQYKREIQSNLKYVGRICFGLPGLKSQNRSKTEQLSRRVPELLQPVLPYLNREGGRFTNIKARLLYPLTDPGLLQLSAMLKVWQDHQPSTLENFLVDHSADIVRAYKRLAPMTKQDSIRGLLSRVRKAFGYKMPPPRRNSVKKENWPPKLRREWEIFEGFARQGVGPEHELSVEAETLGFSIERLSPVSIDDYEAGMSRALGVIPHDDNLGVLDLITVVRKPGVEDRDMLEDDGIPKTHNALVDIFRKSEQDKPGTVKGVGYDSVSFQHFVQAIKAVAVRNGHGRYVKAFRRAYQLTRDDGATERRKAEKKEGLSLAWIDQEIAHLAPQFNRIVRSGSFKRKEGRVKQADRDMFLVLFFVWLVTMRFMGYRQRSLVECEVGKNFIRNADGSITLKFDKTKNGRRLYMELNESRRDSHGLLWDTLSLYYLKVYPYLIRQSGNTLHGRLFVTTEGQEGSFRRFKNFTDFEESFDSGRDRFLRVDDLSAGMRDKLNPHFLRGLCADWMITVLHMTFDEAGEVIQPCSRKGTSTRTASTTPGRPSTPPTRATAWCAKAPPTRASSTMPSRESRGQLTRRLNRRMRNWRLSAVN